MAFFMLLENLELFFWGWASLLGEFIRGMDNDADEMKE